MTNEHGKVLKQLREKAGLTQAAFARGLGYTTPQFISNWETGKSRPPVSKFNKLAKMYGVKVDVFIDMHVEHTRKRIERVLKVKRRN